MTALKSKPRVRSFLKFDDPSLINSISSSLPSNRIPLSSYQIISSPLYFSIFGQSQREVEFKFFRWLEQHEEALSGRLTLRFWDRLKCNAYFYCGVPVLYISEPARSQDSIFEPDQPWELKVTTIQFLISGLLKDLAIPGTRKKREKKQSVPQIHPNDSTELEASQVGDSCEPA